MRSYGPVKEKLTRSNNIVLTMPATASGRSRLRLRHAEISIYAAMSPLIDPDLHHRTAESTEKKVNGGVSCLINFNQRHKYYPRLEIGYTYCEKSSIETALPGNPLFIFEVAFKSLSIGIGVLLSTKCVQT